MGNTYIVSAHCTCIYVAVSQIHQFISTWKKRHAEEVWCQNLRTKEKKKLWRKKSNREPFAYPWKEVDYKGALAGDHPSMEFK